MIVRLPQSCFLRPALLLLPLFAAAGLAGCSEDNGPGSTTPGITLTVLDVNTPLDITPDGSLALLEDLNTFEGKVYTYDIASGLLTHVTDVGDPSLDIAMGISADSRISGLHGNPANAGIWSQAAGWTDLPSPYQFGCDPQIGGAYDISADGHAVVGGMYNGCRIQAFKWSDASSAGEFIPLDPLGSSEEGDTLPPQSRASVVSDDGQIAAGYAQLGNIDRKPAVWRADGSGFLLPLPLADAPGDILSISADGSIVAGIENQDAFYWSEATNMVILGHMPGVPDGTPTFPNAIAAGGKLIFGASGDGFLSTQVAFYWTEATGFRSLDELAHRSLFAVPKGYTLTNVFGASTDGTVVIGTMTDDRFHQKTFIIKAPLSVYGL